MNETPLTPKHDISSMEADAQALIDDTPHYVNSVAEMTDRHDLSATDDIVSASGIKLVARGTKINEHLLQKLSEHHLAGTILERSVSISGGLTVDSLARDIGRLLNDDSWLRQLETRSGDPGAMRHGASRLVLHREILFRLTVAREQRPELYRHTLSVAIISQYLALRLRLGQSTIDSVVIAALCHDLGELHTDPAILEQGHRVSDEERRYIYVHPITGWLIVRNLEGLNPDVAKAILQHQERLDGSGYPSGSKGDAIGLAGRILAAADVSASIMSRFGDHHRLSTLLRLNLNKYDRSVVDLLHEAFIARSSTAARLQGEELGKRLAIFAQLLDGWSQLRADVTTSQTAPVVFLTERMYNLRTVVLSFGFDPDSLESTRQLADDDVTIATELATVVDELQFQLADLGHEIERRAPEWQEALDPHAAAAFGNWKTLLNDCVRP